MIDENPGLCWSSQCGVPVMETESSSREQCREPGSKAALEAAIVSDGSSHTALGSRK